MWNCLETGSNQSMKESCEHSRETSGAMREGHKIGKLYDAYDSCSGSNTMSHGKLRMPV